VFDDISLYLVNACAPSASIAVAARPPIKSFFNSTIVVRASFARRRRRRGRVEECRHRRDARRLGTPSVAKGRPLVTLRSKRHTAKHRLYTRVDPVYFINYYAYACKLYFYLEYVKTR
jgi:hypothetical protein